MEYIILNKLVKIASECGIKDILELLVDNHAEINVRNDSGHNALYYGYILKIILILTILILTFISTASVNEYLDCVEYLISKGADVNNKNNSGFTSLMAGI